MVKTIVEEIDRSDVALEELPEPVPHPVLEQEGQHGHGQLQEKDEHNGTAELQGDKHGSRSHYTSGLPARRASLSDPEPLPAANSTSSAPKRPTLESGESHVISWVLWATHPYSHCCIVGKSQLSESMRKLQDNVPTTSYEVAPTPRKLHHGNEWLSYPTRYQLLQGRDCAPDTLSDHSPRTYNHPSC